MTRVEIMEIGNWQEHEIHAAWSDVTTWRASHPRVTKLIDEAWAQTLQSPAGAHLFDGAMCRLDRYRAEPNAFRFQLSPVSYRTFLGTNMRHPELAEEFGAAALANPLGLSAALISSDGWLMFGHRSARVAYYPQRIHPFAGSVEAPRDGRRIVNVCGDLRRELNEELSLEARHIEMMRCIALVRDCALRQPELIFTVRAGRTRQELEAALETTEHAGTFAVSLSQESLEKALNEPLLTPIGRATVLLMGRDSLGEAWFKQSEVGIIDRDRRSTGS